MRPKGFVLDPQAFLKNRLLRSGRPVWGPRLFWRQSTGLPTSSAAPYAFAKLFSSTKVFAPAGNASSIERGDFHGAPYVKSAFCPEIAIHSSKIRMDCISPSVTQPVFASEIGVRTTRRRRPPAGRTSVERDYLAVTKLAATYNGASLRIRRAIREKRPLN